MRKHLSTLFKLFVTVAGLAYVVWEIPLEDIQTHIINIHWGWVFICFMLMNVSLLVRAYRWQLLLKGLGVTVGFLRLLELYFVGSFFNIFLPSGFGGDFVRVVEVAQDVPANIAAGTVIVDRMMGLLALFLMALAGLPFRPAGFPPKLFALVIVVSSVGLMGGFLLLDGRVIRRFGRWLPPKLSPVGDGPVAQLLQAVQGTGWQAIWWAFLISILFNLILISWWIAAGLALNLTVPAPYYLLVVPILSIALLIPSVGGLGLREALAPTLFAGAGLAEGQAVALSLVIFVVTRLSGLLGAPVYLALTIRQNRKRNRVASSGQNAIP